MNDDKRAGKAGKKSVGGAGNPATVAITPAPDSLTMEEVDDDG